MTTETEKDQGVTALQDQILKRLQKAKIPEAYCDRIMELIAMGESEREARARERDEQENLSTTSLPNLEFISTMRAPLSEHDIESILKAWDDLMLMRDNLDEVRENDQVEMLDRVADVVGAISDLRTAIYGGWHRANKTAFPDVAKPHTKRAEFTKRAQFERVFAQLNDQEIEEALDFLGFSDASISSNPGI
jgi:hypothetical protein